VNGTLRSGLRKRPLAIIALGVLLVIVAACLAAPLIAPDKPDATNLLATLQGPSASHLLGTDELGRDIFTRLLYGGRATLAEAALVVIVTLGLGVPVGLLAGFRGGWTDRVLMYLADIGLALPVIVLVLLVVAIFNGNLQAAMIGLGILLVPPLSRIIRSSALSVRGELFGQPGSSSGTSCPGYAARSSPRPRSSRRWRCCSPPGSPISASARRRRTRRGAAWSPRPGRCWRTARGC